VAIAGVLAMGPDLIIFDEATSMLDPKGKAEIAAIVSKMRKENPKLTILSITHDVEEAASADEVLVINDGKAFLQGTPNEVFSHEEELHSIQLDIPFVPGLINELKRQGFSVPEDIKTLEALEDYLCQ
jgi:energy-coupling factor transport system ATP-binding protein